MGVYASKKKNFFFSIFFVCYSGHFVLSFVPHMKTPINCILFYAKQSIWHEKIYVSVSLSNREYGTRATLSVLVFMPVTPTQKWVEKYGKLQDKGRNNHELWWQLYKDHWGSQNWAQLTLRVSKIKAAFRRLKSFLFYTINRP